MAKRDELEQRRLDQLTDDLAAIMAERLPAVGVVAVNVATIGDLDRWRAAARRAGRRLGVRVRTGVSLDGSTVYVVDNASRDAANDDDTVARMGDLLDDLDPRPGRPSLRIVEDD